MRTRWSLLPRRPTNKMAAVAKRRGQQLPVPPSGKSRDRYIGETKNQLRHGYGVYNYENKFFRYEGEWENGLKHGHGKLLLGDGGYYEGTFVRGEIEGHGYRVFGGSGRMYTGQFSRGEPEGQGLMRSPSGEQYEGDFKEGRRDGFGTLTNKDGACYEGEFHGNCRHGEGLQEYTNGDQYKGDWVKGQRHGHGVFKCSNGTKYEGQWRGGMYHGEGTMTHSSGVHYTGTWTNGKPNGVADSVRLVGGAKEMVVVQGERFDIQFECIDSTGSLTSLESGRSFKVSAALLKKEGSSSQRQDHPEEITTPYELLQYKQSADSTQTSSQTTTPSSESNTPPLLARPLQLGRLTNELYQLHSSSTHTLTQSPSHPGSLPRRSSIGPPSSKSLQNLNNLNDDKDSLLESYTTPLLASTNRGQGTFWGLFLPPPILPLPQIKNKKKKRERTTSSSSKLNDGENYSPSPSPSSGQHTTPPIALESTSKQSLAAVEPSRTHLSDDTSVTHLETSTSCALIRIHDETEERKKMAVAGGEEKEGALGAAAKSKVVKKLLQKRAKHCSTGIYIITVEEVTEPPFLDHLLDPLHIQVNMVSQKTKKTKESSLSNFLLSKSKPLQ